MHKVRRTFILPRKLVDTFAHDLKSQGCIREWALAAALVDFLEKSPEQRDACFDRYAAHAREHLGDDGDPRIPRPPKPRKPRTRHSTFRPYRDRCEIMCLKIPPPDQQMIIGGKTSKKEE